MKTYPRLDDRPETMEFYLEGSHIGILLVHGFTASPAQMQRLGQRLHQEGYTVHGLRLPGHGTHIQEMEKCSWRDWLNAVSHACRALRERCSDVFVIGLSMGGLLTLLMASEQDIRGAVPINAAISLTDRFAPYAWLIKYFVRYRDDSNYDIHSPNISYSATPIRKVPDLLRLQKMTKARLELITCPLLIVQGMKDRTVRINSGRYIERHAVSAPRQLLLLENSPHVCTIEPEFDTLSNEILAFITHTLKK